MAIMVVVEFHAKPGRRAELKAMLTDLSAEHGAQAPGFLGSTVYEMLDDPEGLIEIAEWESEESQATAVREALASGVYAPVVELVSEPFRATRIGPASDD